MTLKFIASTFSLYRTAECNVTYFCAKKCRFESNLIYVYFDRSATEVHGVCGSQLILRSALLIK